MPHKKITTIAIRRNFVCVKIRVTMDKTYNNIGSSTTNNLNI